MKSCPIAKSAQNFDKYLINPQTNAQKSFNFCRSGKILSNLVTLDTCLITCIGSVSEPRLTELLKLSSLPNLSKKKSVFGKLKRTKRIVKSFSRLKI